MTHSFSIRSPILCSQCGGKFNFELWLIIDAAADPHLLDLLANGEIHKAHCPSCKWTVPVNAPLLIYSSDEALSLGLGEGFPLLFAPAPRSSKAENSAHFQQLVDQLSCSLGNAWREEWLDDVMIISQDLLVGALKVFEPDNRQKLAQVAREVLDAEDENQGMLLKAIEESIELNTLSQAILGMLKVKSFDELRSYIEAHPKLLDPIADKILEGLIAIEQKRNHEQVVDALDSIAFVLRMCRKWGVDRFFDAIDARNSDGD